jgi:exodeoxyribonuclease VII small subunit
LNKKSTTSAPTDTGDIAAMSFEQALSELEGIVRRLEAGQAELEASINDYSRGMALTKQCGKKLADAKLTVEKIVKGAGGDLSTAPFDAVADGQ